MMRIVPHRTSTHHELFELPRLRWLASRDVTPAAWVHRRFRLPRRFANVVAELERVSATCDHRDIPYAAAGSRASLNAQQYPFQKLSQGTPPLRREELQVPSQHPDHPQQTPK
jgi:hypothetical protein